MASRNFSRRIVMMLAGAMMLACVTPVWAQEKQKEEKAEAPPDRPHVVKMLHTNWQGAAQFGSLLGAYGVGVHVSPDMGLIAISGPPDLVARAEEAFNTLEAERLAKERGVAIDNVEMTVHLFGIGQGDPSSIPAGPLRDVVAELKQTFPFAGYKLLETFVLRARVGQDAAVNGSLPSVKGQENLIAKYDFGCKIDRVQGDPKAPLVSINDLRLNLRVPIPIPGNPNGYQNSDVGFRTAVEIPDGKTIVVGKAGAAGDSQGYLVVLTAKVVR